jgi:4-alpha-glucanotransferase
MNSTLTPSAEIASEYIDAHGRLQSVSAVTRQRLLAAMHTPRQAASPLPPVAIVQGENAEIVLPAPGIAGEWQLTAEQGELWRGKCLEDQPIRLPTLPLGYHQLTLRVDKQAFECRIIVAPVRCYEPDAITQGQSLWGACIQLYTLRSASNWGIGDFSDLKQMLAEVAQRGGACVGLNPLHALFPAMPESASPYSPSSRRWLNMLYIDVAAVEDFTLSEEAQRWWYTASTQQALQVAREAEWVDYTAVTQLKLQALRLAWQQFRKRAADDHQLAAFDAFMAQGGESLLHQGVFDALHAAQIAEDPQRYDWTTWPAALQSPDSAAVRAFRIEHTYEVRFYIWLQWLAASQFAACWAVCQQHQMPIGLYRDLAVGVAQGGAETWSDRQLYCLQASVGAPPDILGPLGQNWGLPPMDPHIMQARAYEPWIALLRANMHDCGALRIDHVMALLRLWWIPQGETAAEGAYVHYPIDDLLAILALESQRHQCMVIGEDLGTVPEKIIGKLHHAGVYSYKVLYFEQTSKVAFRAPARWPRQAMAVATTHDMPTLRGWWQSDDLRLGSELGLYPDKQILAGLSKSRLAARRALFKSLQRSGCLPEQAEPQVMDRELSAAMQRYLADSHSALLGLQPEEWLDMAAPVNIPGTTTQYPNWRRKLSTALETMFADPQVNALLADIDQRRRKVK